MSTAMVSGYGVKVTANDEQMDVKAFAAGFAENGYEEHLESFFKDYPEITDFNFLAFSFLELVEQEFPNLEFVFLEEDSENNAFAVVLRDFSAEVHTEKPKPAFMPGSPINQCDKIIMDMWLGSLMPGYKADWIFEEVSAGFAGIWKEDTVELASAA